ncbi:MAG: TRAP transporter permease [Bacillota bacterium]
MNAFIRRIITLLAVSVTLIQMYTAGFGVFPALIQRPLHLLFVLPLAFLVLPVSKKLKKENTQIIDLVLAVAAIVVILYGLINSSKMAYRISWPTQTDLIMGFLLIILILEGCRRAVGNALTLIGLLAIIYGIFGQMMPGILAHAGFGLERIIAYLYISSEGIYGVPLYVFSTYVFAFIIFGSFLEYSGAGNFFVDLALSLTGRLRGGPAKAAVVSSAMMGMISGSSQANVATTGTFTIPLMKRIGYPAPLAGAIEAVASTGGLFTPPIMGSAAFLMAEFIGIPYIEVAAAAIIPALIYYITVFLVVDIEAVKTKVRILKQEEVPNLITVLKKGGHFLIPVFLIIYLLVVLKSSPMKAAFWATMVTILLTMFKAETRMGPKKIVDALEAAGKRAIGLGMACATAGMVVGMLSLTALAIRVTYATMTASGGNLYIALFFTMLTALILGMGLPAAATYIILAVMAVPALIKMGLDPIVAHFFAFYFSSLAPVTPPVCMASYVASSISGAKPMETGLIAFKYSFPAFIVPFALVYGGEALLGRGSVTTVGFVVLTSILGAASFAFAATGWFKRPISFLWRLGFLIAAIFLVVPGSKTDVFGVVLLGLCVLGIYFKTGRSKITNDRSY